MPSTALDLEKLANLPARCTQLRTKLGVPRSEMARWLGVSPSYLSHLEHGTQLPSAPVFRLFEQLEKETSQTRLKMHQPHRFETGPPPITIGLPPEAIAALDQIQPSDSMPPPPLPLAPQPAEPSAPPAELTLAMRVKAIRDQLGVSRPKLAIQMGVCRQYITNIENGKRASKPIIKLVEKMEAELREKASLAAAQPALEVTPPVTPPEAVAPPAELPQPPPAAAVTLISPRLAAIPLISMRDALLLSSPLHSNRFTREHFAFGVTDPEAFAIRLSGDSMQPLHADGEIAIVYPQAQPRTGDRVIVRVHDDIGGEVLFRIFTSSDHGRRVTLTSPNPVYPPVTLNRDEILWVCPVASTVRQLIH
jgi:transcriptional regulator with XRE-family HTH domain